MNPPAFSPRRRKASALRYAPPRDAAPRLVAKGQGFVADRIVETARRCGIPVREEPFLVEALSALDLDSQIPPELYRAVAELLVFVYRLNEAWKQRGPTGPGAKAPEPLIPRLRRRRF
jgi:flagellar biosynthesis protein